MKYVLLVVLALGAAVGIWYVAVHEDGPAPAGPASAFGGQEVPVVTVEPARLETLSETIEALGTALANESVTLAAKVTDTVRTVEFEDGDFVEEGAILVQLTNAEEQALLAEA